MSSGNIKEKISKGEVVIGSLVKINSSGIIEVLGYGGFDFVVVDCEHSSFGYLDMENMIRAADTVGISSIVRVASASEEHILHSLDAGACGVQIPGLSSATEVKEALSFAKFFPAGKRGFSMIQRAAKYGFAEKNSYLKSSNAETVIVVHIENKEMAAQVEALCQISELDVLFIGPFDLSQSLGKPGATNDPEVVAVIEKIFETAAKYNKTVGMYVTSQTDLDKYVALGARYIIWHSDMSIFANAVKDMGKVIAQYKQKT